MKDTVTEETLAQQAAQGDATAFADLVGRVYDRVFALGFRLLGSGAAAEDLAQDICETLPDALNWLQKAMQSLPDDLRQTAVLILEPLTQAEVAQILGISEGTVAWRMSEVKKRLRALKEAEQ